MIGVADGLSYLHSNDVIHGDLKGVSYVHCPCAITLTLIPSRISCSTAREFPRSLILDSPRSHSTIRLTPQPHPTAIVYDGPPQKFWRHRMPNIGVPPGCRTFMRLRLSSLRWDFVVTPSLARVLITASRFSLETFPSRTSQTFMSIWR